MRFSLYITAAGSAAALSLLGFSACDKPESNRSDSGNPGEEVEFPDFQDVTPKEKDHSKATEVAIPADRVLRDSQGRELDGTIIGRSSLKLTVIRRVDQARLDVPIDSLSVGDQAWARTLVFQAAPLKYEPAEEAAAEDLEEPPYVKSRREQIIRLEERIRRAEAELKVSDNKILNRTNKARIKDFKDDIAKLKTDIELYRPPAPRE